MTRVKICGCMCVDDALAAKDAGADFIGVMFAASRRRVSVDEAAQIARAVGEPLRELEQESPPPHIPVTDDPKTWFTRGAVALERLLERKRPLVVGVFEDQPVEEVNEICDEAGIDLVQLSGGEQWSFCTGVTRQVIKVIGDRARTASHDALSEIEANAAIAVMLDASRGSGRLGNWVRARDIAERMPIWLAGGLTPDNVASAIREVRPWCVDTSSGVETAGAKDREKIAAFVAAAKGVRV